MKKRLLSLLLALTLVFSAGMSTMAAESRKTSYVDVRTSGGSSGYITIRFRATCQQDNIPTNYSWSSTITPPAEAKGLSYSQNGAITRENHSQYTFSTTRSFFSKVFSNDAIKGGYVDMEAGSSAFGTAKQHISVDR